MTAPFVIGICGGSGSGKTTLAQQIVSLAPDNTVLISHDNYYRDRSALSPKERLRVNFDLPDALETDLLVSHLEKLKAGAAVDCPRYDFTTATRMKETRHVEPRPVIVLEGIFLYHDPELLRQLDLKIYVDLDEDEALTRRILRDMKGERSTDLNWILNQYLTDVKPAYERYVLPSRALADFAVSGRSNHERVLSLIAAYLRERLAE